MKAKLIGQTKKYVRIVSSNPNIANIPKRLDKKLICSLVQSVCLILKVLFLSSNIRLSGCLIGRTSLLCMLASLLYIYLYICLFCSARHPRLSLKLKPACVQNKISKRLIVYLGTCLDIQLNIKVNI